MTTTNVIKTLGAADLDTQELVTNLVAATKEPRQKLIDVEKKKVEVAISTTALLSNAVSTLQSAATQISSLSKLNVLSVSSSDASVVTAGSSGTGAARAGIYSVEVKQLAKPQRRSSNELASSYQAASLTTLTFASGGASGFVSSADDTVSIAKDSTPSQIVTAINNSDVAKNNGLKATLVDKKTAAGGTGPYVIVVEGQSGAAKGFSISSSDSSDVLGLATSGKATDNVALDSIVVVNNVQLQRSTNTITDAVAGLSLQLNSSKVGSTIALNVAADSASVTSNMKNFVEAYNLLSDLVKRATGPAVEGDELSGTLKADSSARGVLTAIRAKVVKESSSKSGAVTHFSSLGVSFDRSGVLQFDESKLASAMQSAPDDVIKALSNNRASPSTIGGLDSGLAGDVAVTAAGLLKSGGVIKAMTDGFDAKKINIETKQTKLDEYIEKLQNQYDKQFSALNAILAEFKATSERLKSNFNQSKD